MNTLDLHEDALIEISRMQREAGTDVVNAQERKTGVFSDEEYQEMLSERRYSRKRAERCGGF